MNVIVIVIMVVSTNRSRNRLPKSCNRPNHDTHIHTRARTHEHTHSVIWDWLRESRFEKWDDWSVSVRNDRHLTVSDHGSSGNWLPTNHPFTHTRSRCISPLFQKVSSLSTQQFQDQLSRVELLILGGCYIRDIRPRSDTLRWNSSQTHISRMGTHSPGTLHLGIQ